MSGRVYSLAEPAHRHGPFAPSRSPALARLREATIALVVERGLDSVDVGALCHGADFDDSEFDRQFGSVRGCALQVYLANIDDFDRALSAAVASADPWVVRLRATGYAAARYALARPLATRFDMIAMLEAGEVAQAHRDRYVRRLIDLIDEGRDEAADPSALGPATAEGVFGAMYATLARRLAEKGEGLPLRAEEIVPGLMYIAVRPYLGEVIARRELAMPAPPGSGAEVG